jgi:hypothetical protein
MVYVEPFGCWIRINNGELEVAPSSVGMEPDHDNWALCECDDADVDEFVKLAENLLGVRLQGNKGKRDHVKLVSDE